MRALKLVGIALGGVIGLIVVLLLAVRLFVDPNAYKGRIEAAVKNSTGRELALSGQIKLAVFPWIALEVGPASLGNPPGFSSEPFAAVQHVALRVKLLPLLRKQLQVGRIEIDGLDLRLRKNAQGKGNWEDFGGKNATPEAPADDNSGSQTLPDLAGVVIQDSRVSYQDMVADHVNLELGHVTSGTPAPVKLKLDLITSQGAQPMGLAAQLNLALDTVRKQYNVTAVELEGTMTPEPGATTVGWKFSAPSVGIDLTAQTLSAPTFTAQLASANLTGSLRGNKIIDAPVVTGAFKLDPVSLRDLMSKLAMDPPKSRDAKTLTKLAAAGDFSYGANAMAANNLAIQLDDSQLRGKVAITNLDTKAVSFDVSIDRIDIDRYRSPPDATPSTAKTSQAPSGAKPTKTPAGSSPDPLKTLQMDGTLAIGNATVASVNLTQLRVSLVAKDGLTHIAPIKAKLYGGDYSGDITLDDRGATPALKIDQSMTGIDMAPLLKDFAKSQRASGRGTVTTNLTARGLAGDALLKTLNGRVTANVDNGAIEGVDLWFEINRAVALIQKTAVPAGQSSGRTRFDAFKASADIANGVASTKDLSIASQNLRVAGQGTTNLVSEAIDYQLKATVLNAVPTTAAAGKTLAAIPFTITGTLASPSVRPDLEGIAKARLQQELDKHKDELKDKLMDKLKGVFK